MTRQPHTADTKGLGNVVIAATLDASAKRQIQRLAKENVYTRLRKGIYVLTAANEEERGALLRMEWQKVAGALAPGAVVSHRSGFSSGIVEGTVTLSHPTQFGKTIKLPGLSLVLLQGCGPLPEDMPLMNTGLHWASATRQLLENLGRKASTKVERSEVEKRLINMLNAQGEQSLNSIRDKAASIAPTLGLTANESELRGMIGELLGTHKKGLLKTADGKLVSKGTPSDQSRMVRFEALASLLRTMPLPSLPNNVPAGVSRHHQAFIESYFSNYVEGTKFGIEEARQIVLLNRPSATRPKDSHDILGVFQLAMNSPYRDSPPPLGADFLPGLETWHAKMLEYRPEVNPGRVKLESNFAGTTEFVSPGLVRGTMEAGSLLARSVPEGMARAIYYAFLVSEVHPFEDGNGRLSRLLMNAEMTRVGLNRIIIPTLFHPQYVDCARALTKQNEPEGFVKSIAKMAVWSSQLDFSDLAAVIAVLKRTNAMEESPAEYKLLNPDGTAQLAAI